MLKSRLIASNRNATVLVLLYVYIYIKQKKKKKKLGKNSVGRSTVGMEKKHLILKVRMSPKLTLTNRLIERWPANPERKKTMNFDITNRVLDLTRARVYLGKTISHRTIQLLP